MTFWDVRLTGPAKKDYALILARTRLDFGEHQKAVYRQLLLDTLKRLTSGPDAHGSIDRSQIVADNISLVGHRNAQQGIAIH